MVIAVVHWMIAEGQNTHEITVLASYNGQKNFKVLGIKLSYYL